MNRRSYLVDGRSAHLKSSGDDGNPLPGGDKIDDLLTDERRREGQRVQITGLTSKRMALDTNSFEVVLDAVTKVLVSVGAKSDTDGEDELLRVRRQSCSKSLIGQ